MLLVRNRLCVLSLALYSTLLFFKGLSKSYRSASRLISLCVSRENSVWRLDFSLSECIFFATVGNRWRFCETGASFLKDMFRYGSDAVGCCIIELTLCPVSMLCMLTALEKYVILENFMLSNPPTSLENGCVRLNHSLVSQYLNILCLQLYVYRSVVLDNNSGTYGPDKDDLAKLQALFQSNFPDIITECYDFRDERLKASLARLGK